MENERMTHAEQAVLLWPLLALAARTQQILSYAATEGYTGIARHGLNRALGLIHDYCKRRGWPLLNTIVVSQQSGMPAEGFPGDLSPFEIKVEQGKGVSVRLVRARQTTAQRFSGREVGWSALSLGAQ